MADQRDIRHTPPTLALRPRDAARALGVSERTLWGMTAPRGPIRCARAGTAILYPVEALREWLSAAATMPATDDGGAR